jgi:outer membrane biosynthesis protein TonB
MKLVATSAVLAACCLWTLTLPACSLRAGGAGSKPLAKSRQLTPPADPGVETAADQPISVPQTQVTLPAPQPIQAEALAVIKVEPPPTAAPQSPTTKPRPAPKSEPRQQTATQTPAGPQLPPPATSRRRIRPVASAEERNRLTAEIATSQRHVHDNLAKAKTRQLTEAEKSAVERILAFLDQADAASKDQDLQQAAALSNRALVLSQDLNSEKLK